MQDILSSAYVSPAEAGCRSSLSADDVGPSCTLLTVLRDTFCSREYGINVVANLVTCIGTMHA